MTLWDWIIVVFGGGFLIWFLYYLLTDNGDHSSGPFDGFQ